MLFGIDFYVIIHIEETSELKDYCYSGNIFHNDDMSGKFISAKVIAFILSLLIIIKIGKIFNGIQNDGLYRATDKYSHFGLKKLFPKTGHMIKLLYFGKIVNTISCILCTIGSCAVIFDARKLSIDAETGELDVAKASLGMILKLLSLFYVANIDSQFTSAEDKKLFVDYLKQRHKEITENKEECQSYSNEDHYCVCRRKKWKQPDANMDSEFEFEFAYCEKESNEEIIEDKQNPCQAFVGSCLYCCHKLRRIPEVCHDFQRWWMVKILLLIIGTGYASFIFICW